MTCFLYAICYTVKIVAAIVQRLGHRFVVPGMRVRFPLAAQKTRLTACFVYATKEHKNQ